MSKLTIIALIFVCLRAPVAALEGEIPHRIDGQDVGWFVSGRDAPTLVLWHQFDQQMGLGIMAGRDSWETLLWENRGGRVRGGYNILALNHPWRNAESAKEFSEIRLRAFVAKIHNFLRRKGFTGEIYTMGASAGASLALLHCKIASHKCKGAVAISGYHRLVTVDVSGLVLDDCYDNKRLLVLNSQSDGQVALREHIRGHECDNIGSFVPEGSTLHGMAWLREQPEEGTVWQKIFDFLGV